MAIPDYQSLMLPFLKIVSDKKEHKHREVIENLASEFKLTDEERKELLTSGNQSIFDNRVGWARTYLKKAGLINSPQRGICIISNIGLEILNKKPEKIDAKYLRQFPSFVEFQNGSRNNTEIEEVNAETQIEKTPEESLDIVYQQIRRALSVELLNNVLGLSPVFFERLVVELLVKMGYGGSIKDAGRATQLTNDEGIDGIIKEDKLGLDIIYIQAKRWESNPVGRPDIQSFVGALDGQRANKGIFITHLVLQTQQDNMSNQLQKK